MDEHQLPFSKHTTKFLLHLCSRSPVSYENAILYLSSVVPECGSGADLTKWRTKLSCLVTVTGYYPICVAFNPNCGLWCVF